MTFEAPATPSAPVTPEATTPPKPGAAPVAEGAIPTTVAEAERVSPKLAALMRKEADAVRRVREAKTMEQSIKAREEAIAAREAKNEQIEKLWKENPLGAIKERGYDFNQLTMMQLNNGQMTPEMQIRALQQEIQSIRQEKEQEKTQTSEQAKAEADRLLASEEETFKVELQDQLEAAKDKYPLTHLYKRSDLIYAEIDKHFQKTLKDAGAGEVLAFDDASKLVEARILKEAQRAQEILQKTAQAGEPQPPPQAAGRRFQEPPFAQWVEKPVKTLAGIQQSVPSQSTRVLSDQDRIDNALNRLRAAKQR